jgi:endonuclease G, mitochondrial
VKKLILFILSFLLLSSLPSFATNFPKLEIHSDHWIGGYPLGMPESNDLIIRRIYALSNNDKTKFADWVAYKLTPVEVMGILDLHRKWKADPMLDETETLEPKPKAEDDYKGANKAHDYDRGHQAPLGSFKGSLWASETNFLSNITPQKADLNQGPWKNLEEAVRKFVKKGNTVWVMTGPIYKTDIAPLPNANETHKVPSAYWKIISTRSGNKIKATAFIMEQTTPRTALVSSKLKTIQEVQDESGLNFFWDLKSGESVLEDNILMVN